MNRCFNENRVKNKLRKDEVMEILGIMFKDKPVADRVEVDGKIIFRLKEDIYEGDIPIGLFVCGVTEETMETVTEWAVSYRNPREIGINPVRMQVTKGYYRCETLHLVKECRASSYYDFWWLKLTDEDTYEKNCMRGMLENIRKGEIIKLTVN